MIAIPSAASIATVDVVVLVLGELRGSVDSTGRVVGDEQRAALLAVPRGLEVLEAAFRAVRRTVNPAVPAERLQLLLGDPRRRP